jgi:hypothetical protein
MLCLLTVIKVQMPPNAAMVLKEIKNAIEMNALPKEQIKDFIKGSPPVEALMKSGGMLVIISIPMLGLAVTAFFVLRCLAKKYPKLQAIVDKIKKILFFNIIIRSVLIAYLSLCVGANFGAPFY